MNRSQYAAVVAISVLAPIAVYGQAYYVHFLVVAFLYALIVSNWDMLFGHAGVWSFGQLVLLLVGGYTSGWLCGGGASTLQLPPLFGIFIGAGAAVLLSLAFGAFTLRLKGIYLALVTLGVQYIFSAIIVSLRDPMGARGVGVLPNIPPITIGSFSFSAASNVPYYYMIVAMFWCSMYVNRRLLNSRIGLAFVAIRDSEPLGLSLGVDPLRYKMLAWSVTAFFTGLAGGFYAHYSGLMDLQGWGWGAMLTSFVMIVIGGWGVFGGPAIGAFIWSFVSDIFLRGLLEGYRLILMGVVLVICLAFARQGIPKATVEWVRSRLSH